MKYFGTTFVWVAMLMSNTVIAKEDGTALLFKHTNANLSITEKQSIFNALNIKTTPDGKSLIDQTCEESVTFDVSLIDLNKDKVPELILIGGNNCDSGATGQSIWLFIKIPDGGYHANLGFPAAGYQQLKHKSKGYKDLQISGMGNCAAIWRWNGNHYEHLKNISTAKDVCNSI
jgi:hypothetical protein